jgi:hypothetical protein
MQKSTVFEYELTKQQIVAMFQAKGVEITSNVNILACPSIGDRGIVHFKGTCKYEEIGDSGIKLRVEVPDAPHQN